MTPEHSGGGSIRESESDARLLDSFLERLAEALLLDIADDADDQEVPIGRFLVEAFKADERGYEYDEDVADLYVTAGELRGRLRHMREARLHV